MATKRYTQTGQEPVDKKHDQDQASEQHTLHEWGIGLAPPEDSTDSSDWYTDEDVKAHHEAMFALNLARAWAHRKISENLESPPTLTSLMAKVETSQDPDLIHMLPPEALIQKAISLNSQASGIDPAVVDMMFVVEMTPSVNPDLFWITPEDLTNIDIPTAASLMGEKGYLDSNFVRVLVDRSIPISNPNLAVGDIVVRAANSPDWPSDLKKAKISIIDNDGEVRIEDLKTGIAAWIHISQVVKLNSNRENDAEEGGDQ